MLINVLGFLKRDELEYTQMVSREFNWRIMGWKRGPLRKINHVAYIPAPVYFRYPRFGFDVDATRRTFYTDDDPFALRIGHIRQRKGQVGKDMQRHGLRNALVGTITVGADQKSVAWARKCCKFEETKRQCERLNVYHFNYREHRMEAQIDVSVLKEKHTIIF